MDQPFGKTGLPSAAIYASRPKLVTDEMFIEAARATADQVTDNQLRILENIAAKVLLLS